MPLFQVLDVVAVSPGDFSTVDLIAAATNALNGALLARRPDHYKQYTIVGILLMAILGGIGGGISRDVLLDKVPVALTNPAYILLCLIFGLVGYRIAYARGQLFREGLFQFMTAFSLPWYAIVGAMDGISGGIPILGSLLLAVVGATTGRYLIDIASGVPPKRSIRGEWCTAVLAGAVWIALYALGAGTWPAVIIAFVVAFVFRLLALFRGWQEPLAAELAGIVHHEDRILLGRKLKGKSKRELRDLGLLVEPEPAHPGDDDPAVAPSPTG
jgi:uncharacterized membrane protein YeiH